MRMWGKLLRKLSGDRGGAVAVLFALTAPILIGFAGLGAEVALWYIARRAAQGAADTAAYSALVAYRAGDVAGFAATAKAIAAQDGFVPDDSGGGTKVTVNRPPLSGPYSGNDNAIEVIITVPQLSLFSTLFIAAPTIGTRAVALVAGSVRIVE